MKVTALFLALFALSTNMALAVVTHLEDSDVMKKLAKHNTKVTPECANGINIAIREIILNHHKFDDDASLMSLELVNSNGDRETYRLQLAIGNQGDGDGLSEAPTYEMTLVNCSQTYSKQFYKSVER